MRCGHRTEATTGLSRESFVCGLSGTKIPNIPRPDERKVEGVGYVVPRSVDSKSAGRPDAT